MSFSQSKLENNTDTIRTFPKFDTNKHKYINETVEKSLWIMGIVSFVGLIIVLVFLFLGISIIDSEDNQGNNQNFGIEYKREYYPPYTSDN